jgi:hypothetical protein
MSKVVDVDKVQRALNRAARNARHGSSDVRAGKFLVGRSATSGQLTTARDSTRTHRTRKKK